MQEYLFQYVLTAGEFHTTVGPTFWLGSCVLTVVCIMQRCGCAHNMWCDVFCECLSLALS
jgi:hypothetical protein